MTVEAMKKNADQDRAEYRRLRKQIREKFVLNETRPFPNEGWDQAYHWFAQAHAMSSVVSYYAREATENGGMTINPELIASALDGVESLIAVALYEMDLELNN